MLPVPGVGGADRFAVLDECRHGDVARGRVAHPLQLCYGVPLSSTTHGAPTKKDPSFTCSRGRRLSRPIQPTAPYAAARGLSMAGRPRPALPFAYPDPHESGPPCSTHH